MARPLITLTTDFGTRDSFVGVIKGVILGINPEAMIVDITHDIEPQNILEASRVLKEPHKYFPENTVHLCVVDPGVGSSRHPIILHDGKHYFVGPDNGVFSEIIRISGESLRGYHVTERKYFLPEISSTFHGRDIFAPVAAWLSKGIPCSSFGDLVSDFTLISRTAPKKTDGGVEGLVTHTDRFGNLITNISADLLREAEIIQGSHPDKATIQVEGRGIFALYSFYSEAGQGKTGALINSEGWLEIFVCGENAQKELNINVGDKVKLICNNSGTKAEGSEEQS